MQARLDCGVVYGHPKVCILSDSNFCLSNQLSLFLTILKPMISWEKGAVSGLFIFFHSFKNNFKQLEAYSNLEQNLFY